MKDFEKKAIKTQRDMTEEVLSRAARGLFDEIANTLINNNDPLAASGRQDHIRQCQCHNSHTLLQFCTFLL